ncbi:MAG TPA: CHAD domain-containing protein [Kofleriaceae bacterium]|nr:CHAD domain-containing protein [Kofleriaceae bacterium]
MSEAKVAAYPEHDKLGPLAHGGQWGDADRRAAVIAAMRQALADGRAAAQRAQANPGEAVHGVRKALRRARALVELIAGALPGRERDDLIDSIRIARRSLSSARDLDVAPAVLAQLELGDADKVAASAIIAALREASPPPADASKAVAEAVERLAHVADALDAALPPALDDASFAEGLAATYKRARRARRGAKKSRRRMHTFRRRTKELTHQLALITAGSGEGTRNLVDPIDELSKSLGDVVDLILVRDLTRAHIESAPAGFDGASLLAAIDAKYDELASAVRKSGKELFDRTGKRFAKKVRRTMAKDREPPTAADAEMPSTD